MFIIEMAELKILIENKYSYVKEQCMDYIDTPNNSNVCNIDNKDYAFSVTVTDEEIMQERDAAAYPHSLGYCESICIYRQISSKILDYEGFVLHASIVEVDGKAYAFAAKSGTGKSTHTALWTEYFKDRARIINGDKPILRYIDGEFRAYGTPWCGKENLQVNASSPVKAVCFIERGITNRIHKISDSEIIDRLFHQIILPQDEHDVNHFFCILNEMCRKIPFYVLQCNISREAVITAYNGINGMEEL